MRIQVKDFMSAPVTIAIGEKRVGEIRNLMIEKGIHAIPIIQYDKQLPDNEETIQGIVTVTDLLKSVDDQLPAEEVMTQMVHVIHKHSSVQAAAKMMLRHQVHHLVVMDDGKIIGIISSLDFVKVMAEHPVG